MNTSSNLQDSGLLRSRAWIGGEWTSSDRLFAVRNPATGEVLAEVARLGATETRAAIDAAEAAAPAWRARTAGDRAAVLRRWHDLMQAHREDLARLLTLEQGKPLVESRAEINYAASFLDWFAEEGRRVYGETIPAHHADKRLMVLRQPVGVSAGITPWNFPSAMVTRKAAPALAAGCTLVLKPAEQTPLSALAHAELARRAGVPAGVFNVVTGAAEDAPIIGGELTRSERIRKLSFTGSTAVGKLLMRQCSDTVKRLSLELGGNAPFIVFDDADLEAAVQGTLFAKFRNAGQVCVSPNRLLVQRTVADRFVDKLAAAVARLRVGNGLDEGVTIGPLIEAAAIDKVQAHLDDARAQGARVVLGGRPHALGRTFWEPTVLTSVTAEMQMSCEETFGPVAGITLFDTEAEAIELANHSRYGLSSYFYSRDLNRVIRVAEALESGIVGVNTGMVSTAVAPFGGMKESGVGREGSRHGIDEWLELKMVCIGGID
jgi:succinate-semialdehyde dehydrogenase / glutarate-semialdehyde dehydrogenase